MASVKIGFLLWPQTASWPELRDAAALADRSGAASLWTWDHLNSIVGPWEGPILEGWTTLAGWSQVTERATLGLMVGANTFRNPGLTAKLATTLDHLSGGRAILGLGGAWFEREHEAFGIDFGSGFGERLDRLDEAVMLVRRLLDGETITHEGPVYPMRDALCAPRPVQVRLPIMIGGSGKKKTLRTLAKYGDQWNVMGELPKLLERDAILREHCTAVGRDESAIERSTTVDIVIRDTHEAGLAYYKARLAANGEEFDPDWNFFVGPPAEIAEGLQPILELGFRHVLIDMPGPYDTETIGRIGELVELLNA
ncbi:MAG TPA: LLM class flavin-dependent oxidoreductase [Candidatus Limnocylindrales bacterium]|jgi:alkanesulfonate monooxygenase SsuD/methylene tetrahydromethanopterin reductase-like flavin-dependent oxidoreductase (luciferase family)